MFASPVFGCLVYNTYFFRKTGVCFSLAKMKPADLCAAPSPGRDGAGRRSDQRGAAEVAALGVGDLGGAIGGRRLPVGERLGSS